ncbi:DUF3278 domain-containing protein [Apilactobacillus quenuiae]|uniref:DUF3278 domain-containing protein n=1 Tax=Apilactobacillus quenuiae TaxID=2008377 RepID=UPI000D019053|nr:DUF3278 domain-containing protein [Apilactobacillus quenuiae]
MRKTKDSLYVRIIKHTYGIHGYFDEYKKQEVNRIGNNAFIILFILFFLQMFSTVFLVSLLDADDVLTVLLFTDLLIFFTIIFYVNIAVSRLKLDQVEAYDNNDYNFKINKFKRKCILMAFNFFICERILFFILDLLSNDKHLTIPQLIISPRENIVWGISAIFVGITNYFVYKHKIKK